MEAVIPAWDLLGRLGNDDVVVVDCRSPEEAERWPLQIAGALRMTLAEILESPWVLPDDELIVLCNSTGEGSLLRRAFHVLAYAGRTPAILVGGLHAWITEGFPTEQLRPRVSNTRSTEPELSAAAEGHG
jgi:rhodanese-related sulfurtransferase